MAEGLWTEAAEHIVGVVTDIIQLVAFAAGAELGKFARLRLSPLIEGMKPVGLPNGQPRLWHPDLKPYEQPDLTVAGTIPDLMSGACMPTKGKACCHWRANTTPCKPGRRGATTASSILTAPMPIYPN